MNSNTYGALKWVQCLHADVFFFIVNTYAKDFQSSKFAMTVRKLNVVEFFFSKLNIVSMRYEYMNMQISGTNKGRDSRRVL